MTKPTNEITPMTAARLVFHNLIVDDYKKNGISSAIMYAKSISQSITPEHVRDICEGRVELEATMEGDLVIREITI